LALILVTALWGDVAVGDTRVGCGPGCVATLTTARPPEDQKRPNAWGLYNMLGYTQEWGQDWEGQ
jgi:hypothetical protein